MRSRRRSPTRRSRSVRRGGSRRRSAAWWCPRATTPQPPVGSFEKMETRPRRHNRRFAFGWALAVSLATRRRGVEISVRASPGRCVVEPAVVSPFAAWESFYVIIGSSGAALTGLQFVVIALSAEGRATRTPQSVGAFGTPTVVHFCAVLLIAGILSMPWHAVSSAALALGICGAAGIVYALIVVRRASRQTADAPGGGGRRWDRGVSVVRRAGLLAA